MNGGTGRVGQSGFGVGVAGPVGGGRVRLRGVATIREGRVGHCIEGSSEVYYFKDMVYVCNGCFRWVDGCCSKARLTEDCVRLDDRQP